MATEFDIVRVSNAKSRSLGLVEMIRQGRKGWFLCQMPSLNIWSSGVRQRETVSGELDKPGGYTGRRSGLEMKAAS